jgi:ubiquinone/menaquinone biosynthesis C-methylase UbiE
MEDIRKHHNEQKRDLIRAISREGDAVLDVGCGFGGDIGKWKHAKVNVSMCEPCEEALEEAKTRAKFYKMRINFYHGDITSVPNRKYDTICYNFSLHYIFATEDLFMTTTKEIAKRVKPGGKLVGIIPDSNQVIFKTPLNHETGSFFVMKGTSHGQFGEKLFVHLVDTPYYQDGAKSEPIAHKDLLVTRLEKLGFRLKTWEPLRGNSISELYSKFIFTYKR